MRAFGRTAWRFVVVPLAALIMVGGALPLAEAGRTVFDTPDLPPLGKYHHIGPVIFQVPGVGGIGLQNILHFPFPGAIRTPDPNDATSEIETFSSLLRASVSAGTLPPFQIALQGPVRVEAFNKIGNVTGTFDTEMLSMDLAGNSPLGPIMIRESPTLPSLGETTITDIGGGLFRFDSFFDVFTELTIDGGQTWIPQERGPARVNLVPEPSAVVLLGIGILGVAGRRLLRRWKTA